MPKRPLSYAVPALLSAAVGAALVAQGASAPAGAADPAAPVVANNTVSLWPAETRVVNVLANDSDPADADLAICRFPEQSFDSPAMPAVMAFPESFEEGTVAVMADLDTGGASETFDHYVCNYTLLSPETLTVQVREVQPVVVRKVARPGRLRVANKNDRAVVVWYGSPRRESPDTKVKVPADSALTIRVHRQTIAWVAVIAHRGIADYGIVRDIALPRSGRTVAARTAIGTLSYPEVAKTALERLGN